MGHESSSSMEQEIRLRNEENERKQDENKQKKEERRKNKQDDVVIERTQSKEK